MAIIGIAGTKQSGKDSAAKYITGMVMKNAGLIRDFQMKDDTSLEIKQEVICGGTMRIDTNILNLDTRNNEFMCMLYEVIWPHVKIYHFADPLKYIISNMFGVDLNVLFGDNGSKDTPTSIKWELLYDILPSNKKPKDKKGFVTHREMMQHFADVLRHINDKCFVNYALDEIKREQCPISIIADIRTKSELYDVKNAGGKIIYLTRRIDEKDTHHIENDLRDVNLDDVDIVIDNQNLTLAEKNVKLENELKNVGFLQ